MKIGIAVDHAGYPLKDPIAELVTSLGHEVQDYGADLLDPEDDFPDFVLPLAQGVAGGEVDRGIAICGSGVGASIAANKIRGVRAALITEIYSAHQGVEHDGMNVACFGGRVISIELASDLVRAYLAARFLGGERFERRLKKIEAAESAW